jgi:hypothetical protein
MGTHPSKVQSKWEHKETQPKEKIENKQLKENRKKSYANRTHGFEITMNDNKEDLRQESFLKQFVGI